MQQRGKGMSQGLNTALLSNFLSLYTMNISKQTYKTLINSWIEVVVQTLALCDVRNFSSQKFKIDEKSFRETFASENNPLDMPDLPDKPFHQRQKGKIDKIFMKHLKISQSQQDGGGGGHIK